MQTGESCVNRSREDSSFFLTALMIVFWWPLQLIFVLCDKTKHPFDSCWLIFIFIFISMGSSYLVYVPLYFLFGIVTYKKNFWR